MSADRFVVAPLVYAFCAASVALAFHSGGVGNCGGCHQTHGPALLPASPTDSCLACHATENGNSWGRDVLVPGGQYGAGAFVFLTEQNINDGVAEKIIPGHRAGHSIVSLSRGTVPDLDNRTSPGGTYPASNLHCTSCHDPHGRGGHFRLLHGAHSPVSTVNGRTFNFTSAAPSAEGIDVEKGPETRTNHTALRGGMSDWCANCHGAYHSEASPSKFRHPVNVPIGNAVATTYNRYRGTGFSDGVGADAYIPEVPLEFPENTTSFAGPVSAAARITCLSCHRAHASSGPAAGRWDFRISSWIEEGVASGTYRIPNPYDSTAGMKQRQLCDKCHGDR